MEREFKWMIPDPSEFDPIADSSTISALVQKKGRLEMEAMYYDTADNLIARCHGGLRQAAGERLQHGLPYILQ